MYLQTSSAAGSHAKARPGITIISVVIALVIIIVVAAVAAYVAIPKSSTSSTRTSTASSTSRSTASTTPTTSTKSVTSTAASPTSSSQSLQRYTGVFNYSVPLGPSGERVVNDTPQTYNSVQVTSGSFSFSFNPSTYIGTGSGQGKITVTTVGFCSGTVSVSYAFNMTVAHPPGENFTIGFDNPMPGNATVPLTCTGSMTGVSQTNNPISFLSEYPGLINVMSIPVTYTQHLQGNISYFFTISTG